MLLEQQLKFNVGGNTNTSYVLAHVKSYEGNSASFLVERSPGFGRINL